MNVSDVDMVRFKRVGKHLLQEYYIENGIFMLRVFDMEEGIVLYCSSVSRVQFYRNAIVCIRSTLQNRKVALLDNGDKTSSR